MTYSDLVSTMDLIVTVIGLIFVIVSLRQTRRSINAATYQHILSREAENWNKVRESGVQVRIKALKNFGIHIDTCTWDPEYDVLLDHIAVFNFYEGIYFLNLQGVLDKRVWENWRRSLARTMSVPEFRESWEKVGHVYNPGFREFMRQMMVALELNNSTQAS
ncbi:MAG: hypothetical protein QXI12_08555 [Candidatus Methanomethyliaceae archaeon]